MSVQSLVDAADLACGYVDWFWLWFFELGGFVVDGGGSANFGTGVDLCFCRHSWLTYGHLLFFGRKRQVEL